MDILEKFLAKNACIQFNNTQKNALTHQFNDLLKQCNTHNDAIKYKKSSKRGKKQRMANALCMLLKIIDLAEQKELEWYEDRTELTAKIEDVSKVVSAIAANTDSCDEPRDEIEQLVIENGSLERRLDELEETCMLREQCIASLGQREAGNETAIGKSRKAGSRTPILGKFDTSALPISLSNRLEVVVAQYILNNRVHAHSSVPGFHCNCVKNCNHQSGVIEVDRSPELNSNWGYSTDRMREMQRIMGVRRPREYKI
ncbi:hypothetical protein AB205_0012520 [Aquarana catesbeiana]|uniref:Uncharacterized protein n=1 Tax=Aquarana catesbeiana TaxID=8400 RepID=A0A2G9RAX1_AQUCT|nr:hypothetical protein AB205_0012520 [Aquarana catesbeiana]